MAIIEVKPRIFIGSSLEGKHIADALQANLDHEAQCTVWDQAFPLSHTTIDTLLSNLRRHDFAIFVLSADDLLNFRGENFIAARDNVLYEAGLASGMYSKERCFLVIPRNIKDFHLPTDLLGFTKADYDSERANDEPRSAVGFATTQIREAIKLNIWSKLKLSITSKSTLNKSANYPLKLNIYFKNLEAYAITIESIEFKLSNDFAIASNEKKILSNNKYPPLFLIGKDATQNDIYKSCCTIKSDEEVLCWIPLDPKMDQSKLDDAIKTKSCGEFKYRCLLHKEQIIVCSYKRKI